MRVFKKIIISLTLALFMSQSLFIPVSLRAASVGPGGGASPTYTVPTYTPPTPIPTTTPPECGSLLPWQWSLCITGLINNFITDIGRAILGGVSSFCIFAIKTALDWGNNLTYSPTYSGSMERVWTHFRDLGLGLLSVAIIIIAVMNILNLQRDKYGLGKIIPKLVVTLFLALFSYAIADFLLGFFSAIENMLVDNIYNVVIPGGDWYKPFRDMGVAATSGIGTATAVINLVLAVIVSIIILFPAIGLWILLGVRVFMLYLLIVISPLAALANLLPFTESLYKKWWSEFFKWGLMGIQIMAILFIGSAIMAFSGINDFIMASLMLCVAFFMAFAIPIKNGGAVTAGIGGVLSKIGGVAKGAALGYASDKSGLGLMSQGWKDKAARNRTLRRAKTGRMLANENNPLGRRLLGLDKLIGTEEDKSAQNRFNQQQQGAFSEIHEGKGYEEMVELLRKGNLSENEEIALLRLVHKDNPAALKGPENGDLRNMLLKNGHSAGLSSMVKDYALDIAKDTDQSARINMSEAQLTAMEGEGGTVAAQAKTIRNARKMAKAEIDKVNPINMSGKMADVIDAAGNWDGEQQWAAEAQNHYVDYFADPKNARNWSERATNDSREARSKMAASMGPGTSQDTINDPKFK